MIIGIGIDLVEIERIRHSLNTLGDRFLERILCPEEIAYCKSYKDPAPRVAGRFAAKEAISKAFGTGISGELGWLDMEIRRSSQGAPYVELHQAGKKLFLARKAQRIHLSISHSEHQATAVAILEG